MPSKIQTKCAYAPWASYNTPKTQLIQYGRRIGKKVYCSRWQTVQSLNVICIFSKASRHGIGTALK